MVELLIGVLVGVATYIAWMNWYFKSKEFRAIKDSIAQYIDNCNELNAHIENLKLTSFDVSPLDYGAGTLSDVSIFDMKRRYWRDEEKGIRTHNCSAAVLKNASDQPFKYLCKYFDVKTHEDSLSRYEQALNNFSAAEQGKVLLKDERDAIVSKIERFIPSTILLFNREKLIRELGFDAIDLSDVYFPTYIFQYVSAGGNSASRLDIKLDVDNMEKFVAYIGSLVKFRKSVAGQRSLMTLALREKIKKRDNHSCRICNLSITDEKNLLLEIDHIIPLSRGGVTSENNLQTLCWKCNRSKGAKISDRSRAETRTDTAGSEPRCT